VRAILALVCIIFSAFSVHAATCEQAAIELNRTLRVKIDAKELAETLGYLNKSRNQSLSPNLWSVSGLNGKSIGGDRFGNREGRLPEASRRSWKEADLDFKGGKRGAKRLLFSNDGLRLVTVDHYKTFSEVPACR